MSQYEVIKDYDKNFWVKPEIKDCNNGDLINSFIGGYFMLLL